MQLGFSSSVCKCSVCGKGQYSSDFLNDEYGSPMYFATQRFFPVLLQTEYFCSPEHSLEYFTNNLI